MARRKIPAEQREQAEQLVAAGTSRREVSRITGIATSTLSDWFGKPSTSPRGPDPSSRPPHGENGGAPASDPSPPAGSEPAAPPPPSPSSGRRRRRDPKPRPRTSPQARKPKLGGPSDEQLESMLRKIAVAPAIPMGLWFHCDFCVTHFAVQGPQTARQLVELSTEYPELREVIVGFWQGWQKYAWTGLIAGYLGIPLAHHLAPAGVYRLIAPLAGMPPRDDAPSGGRPHTHEANGHQPAGPPPAAPAPEPAGGNPYEGLDTDQLLQTARAFGIELAPDDLDKLVAGMMAGDSIEDLAAMAAATMGAPTDAAADPEIPADRPEPEAAGTPSPETPAPPATGDPDTLL
jgi:ribosomal protein L12E/L44/L45/RPP1/RPP2